MSEKLEEIIKVLYKEWKSQQPKISGSHPDEEILACFIKGKLELQEGEELKSHLLSCADCMEKIALQIKLGSSEEIDVPLEALIQAKNLIELDKSGILEAVFKVKDNILELINTSGDILLGQELVPLPVLRSRRIKDFKDEVIIFKDIKDVRVELRLENKQGKSFNLAVLVREKATQKIVKDLRITLLKDNLELESYHAESGQVIFENVLLGRYIIEISDTGDKLARVMVDIKT